MGFVTPAEFVERKDVRSVSELLTDSGDATAVDPLTDAKLATILDDASGAILASFGVGGRYDRAFLDGLQGLDESYLKRVTTEIAYLMLRSRRTTGPKEMLAIQESIDGFLKPFRDGEAVFGLEGDNAGEIQEASRAFVDGPSLQEYRDLNMFPDRARRAGKLYPQRAPSRNNRVS